MKRLVVALLAVTLALATAVRAETGTLQFASLGDFRLESGEVIRACRIGYRTFGAPNADRSNVVLFLTWASGTTEQLISNIGPGRLLDSTKYYVVAVDALGNGVSSSPSNSALHPRMRFPKFTIRDTVEAQHALLTTKLGIAHVRAVVGVSMGGMQTFEWMVAYPDFMDVAIPIVGSPRLAPYDLLHWQTQIDAIKTDPAWRGGNYRQNPARVANAQFAAILLTTPQHYNSLMTRERVFEELALAKREPGFDVNDKIRQTEAMMALDVAKRFGGSMERAAKAVRARTLVVVARQDHVVTPGPATEFARLAGATLLELTGDCGHLAPSCEAATVNAAVSELLAR